MSPKKVAKKATKPIFAAEEDEVHDRAPAATGAQSLT